MEIRPRGLPVSLCCEKFPVFEIVALPRLKSRNVIDRCHESAWMKAEWRSIPLSVCFIVCFGRDDYVVCGTGAYRYRREYQAAV